MSKRRPGSQLTHENWDEEDLPDDGGEFRQANDAELKNRARKVARRRIAPNTASLSDSTAYGDADVVAKPGVFSSFGGFVKNDKPISSAPFTFLSKSTSKTPTSSTTNDTNETGKKVKSSETSVEKHSLNPEYYAKLKSLNNSVADWISKHINKNPICDLTPIFNDYAKHLKTLDELKDCSKAVNTNVQQNEKSTASSAKFTTFSFNSDPAINTINSSGFSFGSAQPFALNIPTDNSNKPLAPTPSNNANDENEDEPPKVEFTPVVENDSLYSKRCKIYVKSDAGYKERGVGMLYIKAVEDHKKTQLIVRADTNLGNILLNILLTESVPAKRIGKNDVMIVCLPTPEAKPPPVPVLIRVKTGDDADELLANITKNRK